MSDSSIKPDWNLLDSLLCCISFGFINNFLKDLNSCWGSIELSCSVITDIDTINSSLKGKSSILSAHDSLGEDWQLGVLLYPLNYTPVDFIILRVLDKLCKS